MLTKFYISALTIVLCPFFCSAATAQRAYTWEEVCRNAGWTDGACAPREQQVRENSAICNRRQKALGFHDEPVPKSDPATIANGADIEVLVELMGGASNADIINGLGLVMCLEPNSSNGFAYVDKTTRLRVLAFDPLWVRAVTPESYLVIAHELGHHVCKHEAGNKNPRASELEADRFAGAAIKRFEAYHGKKFLSSIFDAAQRTFSESGSRSHPPRADRIEAIKQGYQMDEPPCRKFAPTSRGPGIYAR